MTSAYKIYSDGSCLGNPGPGGWCAIIITPEGREMLISGSTYGECTTNNRMELLAVINAVKTIPEGVLFSLQSDSKYIIDFFLKRWYLNWQASGWRNAKGDPVKNQDLWIQLLMEVSKRVVIGCVWIKAHNGHHYNEMCDTMANQEARRIK